MRKVQILRHADNAAYLFWSLFIYWTLQFSTEELVKEVQNSIQEFQQHQQEYDEDRVKLQVGI